MDITKQDFLYEVLLRFDEGGFVAAHQIRVEKYIDKETGEVLSEKQGAPMPLSAGEIESILGAEMTGMTEQIAELEARLEESQTQFTG